MKKNILKIVGIVVVLAVIVLGILGGMKIVKNAQAGARAAQYLDAMIFLKYAPTVDTLNEAVLKAIEESQPESTGEESK